MHMKTCHPLFILIMFNIFKFMNNGVLRGMVTHAFNLNSQHISSRKIALILRLLHLYFLTYKRLGRTQWPSCSLCTWLPPSLLLSITLAN